MVLSGEFRDPSRTILISSASQVGAWGAVVVSGVSSWRDPLDSTQTVCTADRPWLRDRNGKSKLGRARGARRPARCLGLRRPIPPDLEPAAQLNEKRGQGAEEGGETGKQSEDVQGFHVASKVQATPLDSTKTVENETGFSRHTMPAFLSSDKFPHCGSCTRPARCQLLDVGAD